MFVFLAAVSTLPFSTSLWGHHLKDPLALTIYFANQFLLGLVLSIQVLVIGAQKHVNHEAHQPIGELRLILISSTVAFAVAVIVAWFAAAYSGLSAALIIAASRILRRRLYPKTRTAAPEHA